MGPATDPAALEDGLAALAARVRRLRLIRGSSYALLIALLAAWLVIVLDARFALSAATRCWLEAAWFALASILVWRFVARPWQTEVPLEEIAERVEFDGVMRGSPNLVAALARERQKPRIFPIWPAAVAVSTGAIAVIASLVAAVTTPGAGEQFRRVALPWYRPLALAPFEIIVTTGDAVVRTGESVTLAAYLKPRDSQSPLAAEATLVRREAGSEQRLPMIADGGGAFHLTLPGIAGDFEYRVEAAAAASPWQTVLVANAVEVNEQSSLVVTPPAYAKRPPRMGGFADLTALQYSTASITLRFTRPAESSSLEWRPEGRNPFEAPDAIPVKLSSDRLSGTASLQFRAGGRLTAVLINESGPRRLRTEAGIAVRVIEDSPPRFEHIAGLVPKLRTARPGSVLHIRFAAVDDFGPGTAELEVTRGTATERLPIPLTDGFAGETRFTIPPDAKPDEQFQFRLRIRDERRVPEVSLAPQESLYPPAGSPVRIAATAPSLEEQEFAAHRDRVNETLAFTSKEVAESLEELQSLAKETADVSPLPLDKGYRIAGVRERLQKAFAAIDASAREAALTVELRPLSTSIGEAAADSLRVSNEDLQQAMADDADKRAPALGRCIKQLHETTNRLARATEQNARLAQQRIDSLRLTDLANAQAALASRATRDAREAALRDQRQLLSRLAEIRAASDLLRHAADLATKHETARFATEVKTLGAALKELNGDAARFTGDVRQELLGAIISAQAELLKRLEAKAAAWETPARIAGLAVPKAGEFLKAADLLKQDQAVEALTELERLAQSLDRTAGEFERWAAERRDPKLALVQLAKWQDDLRTRVPTKQAARAEQDALAAAVETMRIPTNANLREAALVHLRLASKRLESGGDAEQAMKLASEALLRLAGKLPGLPERLATSRVELDKQRLEQDAILAAVELILRPFDKQPPNAPVIQNLMGRFGPFVVRQQKVADRLAALDCPGHEERLARVVRAAKIAANDLKEGLPLDSVASLGAIRRETEQLKTALEGQTPADEKAADLAAKQAEALRLLLAAGEAPPVKAIEPIVALQLEVFNKMEGLTSPEAPALLHEAKEAVKLAEKSLRDGSKHEVIVRRSRDAAEALNALADRMADREPERDRIRRLIANRRTAECTARKLAGKPLQPDASADARNELDHELTELLLARVGAAGQVPKKRAMDGYLTLKNRPEPDRSPAEQKQLAAVLAELLGTMNDVRELTTRPAASAPLKDPAEAYLPSALHGKLLRELAKEERVIRERLNGVPAEVAKKIAGSTAEAKWRARSESLARQVIDLSQNMSAAAIPADTAKLVRDAGRHLTDAAKKPESDAAKLRSQAAELLQQALDDLVKAAGPKGKDDLPADELAVGSALVDAERAMKRSLAELDAKSDPTESMRRAEAALRKAVPK
jgi:hypothetical protein